MGHKGVSKRKPKKDNSLPNANIPVNDDPPVQTLTRNNDIAPNTNKGNSRPGGSSKKNKRGK